jgi:hypothetical protein
VAVESRILAVERRRLGILCAAALLLAGGLPPSQARAVLVEKNDLSLPASLDGNNITQDSVTGLQWLDVTVSADRSFDDIVGNDGTNELAPGGDFEGFRHATADELTGWNPGPQFHSLFSNFGFNSTFSSIGTYGPVRSYLALLGCHGSCASYGRIYGIYVTNGNPLDPEWAEVEAFKSSGFNWGSLGVAPTDVFPPRVENSGDVHTGHYLVRPTPAPTLVPVLGAAGFFILAALLAGVGGVSLRSWARARA